MSWGWGRGRKAVRPVAALTLLVVAVGVLVTFGVARWRADADDAENQRRFETLSVDTASLAGQQVTRYADQLQAAAAFESLAPNRTKTAFAAFGQSLDVAGRFPALAREGLSFVARARVDDVGELTSQRRADGSPEFVVRWAGSVPAAADHAVIAFTTPTSGLAEGVDLVGSAPRRAALEAARDTGLPAMTSPLSLLVDDAFPANERPVGFEVYAPVYRSGLPTVTIEQRRDALVGWIVGSSRAADFLDGIRAASLDQVGFAVHDGDGEPLGESTPAIAATSARHTSLVIGALGRQWAFDFTALPAFNAEHSDAEWAIVIGGLIATVALAALMFVLANQRRRLAGEVAEAVRESETLRVRFQSIFEHGPVGVVLAAPDGEIVALNPQMEAMLGYPDPPHRTLFDAMEPSQIPTVKRWLAQLLSGERQSLEGEREMLRPDGSTIWVRLTFAAARDDNGNAVAVVGHVTDISVEREERERVRLAEERFRLAFAHATTGMALLNPEGQYVQVNDALCAIVGRPASELIGMRFIDIRHDDDQTTLMTLRRRMLDGTSDAEHIEGRFVRPDGSVVWGRTSVAAIRNPDGSPAYFISLTEDVTAQREAEAALRRRQRWFEALVEHASDVVCLLDATGAIVWASPSADRVLGYGEGEYDEEPFTELVHPDDRERVEAAFEEAAARPGPAPPVEFRIRHADGTWRHFETLATNLLDDPDVAAVVTNSRDVSERVLAAAQVTHRALHDSLTGLANRQLLLDRLEQALARAARSNLAVATLYLDLDGFKSVNDQRGHGAGDQVLVTVGDRLRNAVRPGDTVARLGGDEFVVVSEGMTDISEAVLIAERIRSAIAEPIRFPSGDDVVITASVGIAAGDAHATPDRLLRDADTALYRAKALGKDRCELFDSELQAQSVRRLGIEMLLRQALEQGDLLLHYQPIIDLETRRAVALEALLRLERPTGELVGPRDFLAIAEETGLIVTIGAGVLDEACRQLVRWRLLLGERCPERVAVNLSLRQLVHTNLLTQVTHVLGDSGADASMLSIEVSESALRAAPETALAPLVELREMGVTIGLDNFGFGPASLTSLKQLPVDYVKIDRMLIAGLGSDDGDAAVVRAIVELAGSLGLVTVAEGVERVEQVDVLDDIGCTRAQGFVFAAPEPSAVVEHSLLQTKLFVAS